MGPFFGVPRCRFVHGAAGSHLRATLRPVPMSQRDALAIHEAARAVVGEALGLALKSIDVDLTDWHGGATFETEFGPEMWRSQVLVSLAGEEAQRRVDPDEQTLYDERGNRRAADDWRRVNVAVSQYNDHDDALEEEKVSEARIKDGQCATIQLLGLLWPAVQAVAAAIEAGSGTVNATDFQRVLNTAMPAERRAAAAQQIEFIRRPFDAP